MPFPIVVDANVLFAAVLRDSTTRRLLLHGGLDLYAPAWIWDELARHLDVLVRRARVDANAVHALMDDLRVCIEVIGPDRMAPHVARARSLVGHIDDKDIPYAAAVLAVDGVLWTHDKHLATAIPVTTTRDLLAMGEP